MKLWKKDILNEQLNYALTKVEYHAMKKLLFGIMGGLFVGLAYVGYLAIYFANGPLANDKVVSKFLASSIFPAGIILCLFLGGNLFTSNSLIITGVLKKKIKLRMFALDLVITWFANAIGAIFIASLAFGANIFKSSQTEIINFTLNSKVNLEWWSVLLSGIICNILVAGSIFAYNSCSSKGIGVFVVYIVIFLFALSGSQHVVANFFVISEGGFLACKQGTPFSGEEIGKIFYANLIPTTIGNMIGGFIIPIIYLTAHSFVKKEIKTDILIQEQKESNK